MSIISIINGATPCKFSDNNVAYVENEDIVTLKYINSKYEFIY